MPYKSREKRIAQLKKYRQSEKGKAIINKARKAWSLKNPEKIKKSRDKWLLNNLEKRKKISRDWARKNKNKLKDYREKNREKLKLYRKKNRDKIRKRIKKWRAKNKNSHYAIWEVIRKRFKKWLKNENYYSREDMEPILGCTRIFFKEYIANQFYSDPTTGKKMSWDNHGKWHIDHIVPLSSFDPKNETQIKYANHFTNMRPLWAAENLSKGKKVIEGLNPDTIIGRSEILSNLKQAMKKIDPKFMTAIMSGSDPYNPDKQESPEAARSIVKLFFGKNPL